MRSLVREAILKYFFSKLFNPDDEGLFDVLVKDFSDKDKEFAISLKNCVEKDFDKYTNSIEKMSKNFNLDRIHSIDKCCIIIGMAELDNFTDTPTFVIIDEAVNLSAKYSTENSVNFVNGILAEYAKGRNNDKNN